jgi:hypothetical protein
MPWLMLNGWMTAASARADLRESSPQLGRPISTTVWVSRWSSNVARAHAVLVRVLSPAETLIAAAARRSTTHPAVVAASCITRTCGNCAATSSGVDARIDGWDIRSRWFGVVVGATPQTGELPHGETIPWQVISAQIALRERRSPR